MKGQNENSLKAQNFSLTTQLFLIVNNLFFKNIVTQNFHQCRFPRCNEMPIYAKLDQLMFGKGNIFKFWGELASCYEYPAEI